MVIGQNTTNNLDAHKLVFNKPTCCNAFPRLFFFLKFCVLCSLERCFLVRSALPKKKAVVQCSHKFRIIILNLLVHIVLVVFFLKKAGWTYF